MCKSGALQNCILLYRHNSLPGGSLQLCITCMHSFSLIKTDFNKSLYAAIKKISTLNLSVPRMLHCRSIVDLVLHLISRCTMPHHPVPAGGGPNGGGEPPDGGGEAPPAGGPVGGPPATPVGGGAKPGGGEAAPAGGGDPRAGGGDAPETALGVTAVGSGGGAPTGTPARPQHILSNSCKLNSCLLDDGHQVCASHHICSILSISGECFFETTHEQRVTLLYVLASNGLAQKMGRLISHTLD